MSLSVLTCFVFNKVGISGKNSRNNESLDTTNCIMLLDTFLVYSSSIVFYCTICASMPL
ncbi:hypothetical protein HanRHA438_Chr03g0138861 [Helianthus annuus]|nr:hypothetical protein HanHA300_Chr03g0106021 [Helianthus annuus]KAJ0602359.1 hypothetical protein HanIR_Chr03g0138771 [Helianthus annuus]KAJ0609241.1 hypothetical protein HanHA89_Chr03g0117731 [Helianthus annuus]KAJ0937147.1 hypothetical protein HanRHA438_Chr03g0138861 [Helianthus annuus]